MTQYGSFYKCYIEIARPVLCWRLWLQWNTFLPARPLAKRMSLDTKMMKVFSKVINHREMNIRELCASRKSNLIARTPNVPCICMALPPKFGSWGFKDIVNAHYNFAVLEFVLAAWTFRLFRPKEMEIRKAQDQLPQPGWVKWLLKQVYKRRLLFCMHLHQWMPRLSKSLPLLLTMKTGTGAVMSARPWVRHGCCRGAVRPVYKT